MVPANRSSDPHDAQRPAAPSPAVVQSSAGQQRAAANSGHQPSSTRLSWRQMSDDQRRAVRQFVARVGGVENARAALDLLAALAGGAADASLSGIE